MKLGNVIFNHYCKNDSQRYVLVGNCSDFISDHETMEEASEALSKISVGDSKWVRIQILAPGESAELKNLQQSIYSKVEIDSEWDPLAEFRGN